MAATLPIEILHLLEDKIGKVEAEKNNRCNCSRT